MKRASILSLLIACLLVNVSCKKKQESLVEPVPSADFTFDKSEYTEGQTITLTSTSTNGSTFRWTAPEGTTGKGSSFSYPIPRLGVDRQVNFRLDAISSGGLKSDYIVKSVSIKAPRGKLVFYQGYTSNKCTIFVDGVKLGDFYLPVSPSGWPTAPECGDPAYPTTTVIIGEHLISYQFNGGFTYSKTVNVTENSCTAVSLQ